MVRGARVDRGNHPQTGVNQTVQKLALREECFLDGSWMLPPRVLRTVVRAFSFHGGTMLPILGLAATLLGGCYKNTMTTSAPEGEVHESTAKFYLWGLVGENSYDLDKLCPSGVSKIEEEMNAGNALVSCITCSVATPITVRVSCSGGSAFLVQPDTTTGVASITTLDGESK